MKNKLLFFIVAFAIIFMSSCNKKIKLFTSYNEYIIENKDDGSKIYIALDSVIEYKIYGKIYKITNEHMIEPK